MGHKTAQFPAKIWDGFHTGNNFRTSRGVDTIPDFHDYDALSSEIIALETIVGGSNGLTFALQVTCCLFVDMNRTDTYIQDGSIINPFKTLQASMDKASMHATELDRYAIILFPGRYVLSQPLILKAYVDIYGWTADTAYIEYAGEVIQTPTDMNLGGVILGNLLVSCTSTTETDWACRIKNRGNVLFKDTSIFSTARGIIVEGDSVGIGDGLGVMSVGDSLEIQGTSTVCLTDSIIGSSGAPYYDLIVGINASVQMDDATRFDNDLLQINGTATYVSRDKQITNTSNVPGSTVKDALNTLAHTPDPTLLGDGNYHLNVANGIATWVLD